MKLIEIDNIILSVYAVDPEIYRGIDFSILGFIKGLMLKDSYYIISSVPYSGSDHIVLHICIL